MDYKTSYNFWMTDPFFDEDTHRELAALTDEKEIEDRFYKDLEFGTGGLRGILGAGSNRINKYNVRRATTGFADYLIKSYGKEAARSRGVAVAYDCRNGSKEFAMETAVTMAACGIKAYLFDILSATPLLSYTVRHLNCIGGVVITASHNPKEYNGYKAYDSTGCQLCPKDADEVIKCVNAVDITKTVSISKEEAESQSLLKIIGDDILSEFVSEVLTQAHDLSSEAKLNLKVVYSPLHGAGLVPVTRVLEKQGYANVKVVEAQAVPDGNFSTVRSPNPEERDALSMAIAMAESDSADLAFATDPDSDRIGIAVRDSEGSYILLSGNQTGALLTDYVLKRRSGSLNKRSALIKTIVTGELGADIARKHGLTVFETLTGFKFIGEMMNRFERDKSYQYVMGYEESYGYLVGTHARDKDAVVSAMLICEMAAYYKEKGLTLTDVLSSLYQEYGYYLDHVESYTLKGKDGQEKIAAVMSQLRHCGTGLMTGIAEVKDYVSGLDGLPASDVLKYIYSDGSWMAVRPSGTEPKIKIYYSIKSPDIAASKSELKRRHDIMSKIIEG